MGLGKCTPAKLHFWPLPLQLGTRPNCSGATISALPPGLVPGSKAQSSDEENRPGRRPASSQVLNPRPAPAGNGVQNNNWSAWSELLFNRKGHFGLFCRWLITESHRVQG